MHEIAEVTQMPIESDCDPRSVPSTDQSWLFSSRTTSMSSVGSMGLKRAPDCSLPPSPAITCEVSPCAPVVNLPQVEKSRKRSSFERAWIYSLWEQIDIYIPQALGCLNEP